MKIDTRDYNLLKGAVKEFLSTFSEEVIQEHRNTVPYVKDQFVSFIWSVFHKVNRGSHGAFSNNLRVAGLNDTHIETALKKILKQYK